MLLQSKNLNTLCQAKNRKHRLILTKTNINFEKVSYIDNDKEDSDDREVGKGVESNITEEFDAILKDVKNNGKTTKLINAKCHGNYSNLHHVITKLLNDLKKYLMSLMKQIVSAINLISINLAL